MRTPGLGRHHPCCGLDPEQPVARLREFRKEEALQVLQTPAPTFRHAILRQQTVKALCEHWPEWYRQHGANTNHGGYQPAKSASGQRSECQECHDQTDVAGELATG